MKVCGVEIKGNDAVICIMSLKMGLYDIPKVRVPKLSVGDASDAEEMRRFQFAFAKLLEDYQVDKVVIKGRAIKGKFAGGAVGFKIESAIQLIADLDVEIMASATIKKTLERSQVAIDFRDTGLKNYQQTAFETVFGYFEGRNQ
ncbi:hypothetical protein tloyanaT_08640 [Thalassotalea loyana]|uniref:DUF3010 family protein n=1 Tax=Thalassotalea loyana TaxID=280483 RepID=A0ABQ6H907_9GAMM|nr:DUF3010 family protein [Thalassotalea loyana]GLX84612.1 hypothetical protein tloyanaT_08640 [Thalassotalea loyana]